MLSAAQEEDLSRLSQMAEQMVTISNKELQNELLTDEEYDELKMLLEKGSGKS